MSGNGGAGTGGHFPPADVVVYHLRMLTKQRPIPLRLSALATSAFVRSPDLRPWRLALVMGLVGLLVRVAFVAVVHPTPGQDFLLYHRLASSLAAGEGYRLGDAPTAWWPVGWPLAMSLAYGLTGPSVWAGRALGVLGGAALVAVGTWGVARRSGARSACWVGMALACSPAVFVWNATLASETLAALGAVSTAVAVMVGRGTATQGALAGALAAMTALVRPVYAAPILLAPLLIPPGRWARFLGTAAVIAGLVLAPWTYRNWLVFGTFVPISNHGGINLWIGWHPGARGSYRDPMSEPMLAEARGRGEVEVDRLSRALALEYMLEHPGEIGLAILKRPLQSWAMIDTSVRYWMLEAPRMSLQGQPDPEPIDARLVEAIAIAVVLASMLALAGLSVFVVRAIQGMRDRRFIAYLALCGLLGLVLHTVGAFNSGRYAYVAVPFFTIVAAWTPAVLTRDSPARKRNRIRPLRPVVQRSLHRAGRTSLKLAVGTLLALVLLEGASSLASVLYKRAQERPIADRLHTQYDPELGWVNVPGLHLPDMYGPGASVRINAQGFRGLREVERFPPPGMTRVVCSGDSHALGYGVDDRHTWCERLAAIHPGFETVNMGQGGYGVDQAFLWFQRDGAKLAPNIHLFTFILNDFQRMESDTYLGYGKPILRVRDGALAVENVPVPKRALYAPWWGQLLSGLRDLRSFEFGETLAAGRGPQPAFPTGGPVDVRAVSAKIFESLRDNHRDRHGALVLVFLPRLGDRAGSATDDWRAFVRTQAARLGVPYIDLVTRLREVSQDEAMSMYILQDTGRFLGTAGHLNEHGNERIATWLHEELMAIPGIAARLPDSR